MYLNQGFNGMQMTVQHELQLIIAKEKHEFLPQIMKKENIDLWLIFVRETAMIPDPAFKLVVAGDVCGNPHSSSICATSVKQMIGNSLVFFETFRHTNGQVQTTPHNFKKPQNEMRN